MYIDINQLNDFLINKMEILHNFLTLLGNNVAIYENLTKLDVEHVPTYTIYL